MTSGLRHAIARRVHRERFVTSWWGVIINPAHIARSGISHLLKEIAPRISGRILDFGCGSKPYESLFTNATRYVGLDVRQSGHDHATSNVDVFYDGKSVPFHDDEFDAVVSFDVFEHVVDLDEALKEIRRVLCREGTLLLSIPFAWCEHEEPYDFVRYTSYGIQHVLERSGFEVIKIHKTTTWILAISQLFIVYVLKLFSPKNSIAFLFFQLSIICPLTMVAMAANKMLPRSDKYFSGLVVVAKNVK